MVRGLSGIPECCSPVPSNLVLAEDNIFSKKRIRRALKQKQSIERQSNAVPLEEHDSFSDEGIYYSCSQKISV